MNDTTRLVEVHTERRWTIPFAQIGEVFTGDESQPVVFQFGIRQGPITRQELAVLHGLLTKVLEDCPEQRIVTLPGAGKLVGA